MITESEAFIEEYKKKLAHESRVLANSLAPGAALRANIGDNDPTILVQPKSKPKPKTTFPVEKVAKISENQLKESAKIARAEQIVQLLEDKRAAFANQKREYIIEHSIASKKKLAATRRTPIAKPKIHKAKQIYIPAPSQTPLHLQKSRWYATLSAEVVAPSIEVESPIITDSQIKKQSFHMEPIENEFPKMAFSSLDFNAVYPDSTVKPKVSTNENLEIVMQMAKMIVKTKSKATEDALAVEIEVKPAALIEDLTNLQQLILKGSRKAHIKYYQRPVLSIASIEDSSQSTIRSTLEINAVNPITKKESGSDIRQLKKSGSKSSLHSLRQRRGSSRYALDTNSSLGKRNGFSEQIIDEMPTSIIEQAVRPRSERKISPLCLADLSNQKELVPRTKAPNTFTFE